jgi:putative sterol carrier protein
VTVAETIKVLQEHFNHGAAAGVNKTIQLNISGNEAGKWAIKIANQACELIPGGVEKPDLTLSLADKDWMAIAEGKLDPMHAYMTGKLKATGDIAFAMRISKLFGLR